MFIASQQPPQLKVAERVGFEPTLEFPPNTLSKRAPSATRTPLRGHQGQYSIAEQAGRRWQTAGGNLKLEIADFRTLNPETDSRLADGKSPVRDRKLQISEL